jgi:hypothetical protein
VLFFREQSGAWVAQALERNIAAHGQNIEQAKVAFERTVDGYLKLDAKLQREPLSALAPASEQYWAAWERVANKELETRLTSDEPAIPPAYMIKAITNESLSAIQ